MNVSDLLRFLQPGDPEAAAYLNDPNSRPEIGRSRPPMQPQTAPAWRSQMGTLPRPPQEIRQAPAWEDSIPMGPGAGARNPPPRTMLRASLPPARGMAADSAAGFPDAASYLNYGLGQRPLHPVLPARQEVDQTAWRQVAPTMPMYGGGGIYAGQEQRMEPGSLAERRGMEPPSADYPGMLARNGELVRGTEAPAQYGDEDLAWQEASARVRAQMSRQRDPTGIRTRFEQDLAPLRARAERDRLIADSRARHGGRYSRR